jgi:hypothetical protein
MRRKLYYMEVLNSILESNKVKLKSSQKVYPMINCFDPETIQGWMDMRILILDVGLRFSMRI